MSLTPPSTPRLDDQGAELVRREHDAKIVEIQRQPAMGLRIVPNVSLADATATPIAHGLGRVPTFAFPSFVRSPSTSGRIEEIRDGSVDRSKFVLLKASGYGATITIDLAVL